MKRVFLSGILSAVFVVFSFSASAQQKQITDINFATETNLAQYESQILDLCNWVLDSSSMIYTDRAIILKFLETGKVVLDWVHWTPTIFINLLYASPLRSFDWASIDLDNIGMAAEVKYLLELKKRDGTLNLDMGGVRGETLEEGTDANYAGFKSIIKFCNEHRESISKKNVKKVEKWAKMEAEGKLKEYVAKKMKKLIKKDR